MVENMQSFEAMLAKAIAILCKSFPTPTDLSPNDLGIDLQDRERMQAASGVITWLHRNGLVTGLIDQQGGGTSVMTEAQLSATVLRLLRRTDPDLHEPLFDRIVRIQWTDDPDDNVAIARVAEALLR